jgi:hypothetical protein
MDRCRHCFFLTVFDLVRNESVILSATTIFAFKRQILILTEDVDRRPWAMHEEVHFETWIHFWLLRLTGEMSPVSQTTIVIGSRVSLALAYKYDYLDHDWHAHGHLWWYLWPWLISLNIWNTTCSLALAYKYAFDQFHIPRANRDNPNRLDVPCSEWYDVRTSRTQEVRDNSPRDRDHMPHGHITCPLGIWSSTERLMDRLTSLLHLITRRPRKRSSFNCIVQASRGTTAG